MPLFSVLSWDETNSDLFAWRHPVDNITMGSQLIVAEGQEAVLLREGRFVGPFGPGRYTLDVRNIPVLQSLVNLPFGGTPFPAAVWFVRKMTAIELQWGTPSPVTLLDPKFGIAAPVRARGTATFRISDPCKFLVGLVGTVAQFSRDDMESTMRPALIQAVSTALATTMQAGNSVLELPLRLDAISASTLQATNASVSGFGVEVSRVWVESVNFPDDDPGIQALRKALADNMQLGILGQNYSTVRGLDVLQAAASNQGGGGAIGAGLGIGAGFAGGQMLGGMLGGALAGGAARNCTACGKPVPPGGRFCPACGAAQP
jgi:membrane protease subunit (stomatin/prohibitin family)